MTNSLFKTAIILAGGESKRMGFDKQFLMLEENRLMESIIKQLSPMFNDFIIVTNKPKAYSNFEVEITSDYFPGKGPLAGVHAGLMKSKSKYVFVLACDMPQVNLPLIQHQQDILKNKNYDALVTEIPNGKLNPFHGFYSEVLIDPLEKYLIEDKLTVQKFLNNHDTYTLSYDRIEQFANPDLLFTNLNTQEDVKSYIKNSGNKKISTQRSNS